MAPTKKEISVGKGPGCVDGYKVSKPVSKRINIQSELFEKLSNQINFLELFLPSNQQFENPRFGITDYPDW